MYVCGWGERRFLRSFATRHSPTGPTGINPVGLTTAAVPTAPPLASLPVRTRLFLNPFIYSWNPFWGTNLLGISIGRGLGALKGLSREKNEKKATKLTKKVFQQPCCDVGESFTAFTWNCLPSSRRLRFSAVLKFLCVFRFFMKQKYYSWVLMGGSAVPIILACSENRKKRGHAAPATTRHSNTQRSCTHPHTPRRPPAQCGYHHHTERDLLTCPRLYLCSSRIRVDNWLFRGLAKSAQHPRTLHLPTPPHQLFLCIKLRHSNQYYPALCLAHLICEKIR